MSGKEQSPYCSTCVAVADFSSRTEMLPVERGVVDWKRDAALAPLYSLASLYKYAKARPGSPVRTRQILSKYERSSTSLSIFSLNLVENYQPVIELYQTADHPALSPKSGGPEWRVATAGRNGGWIRRILDHHVENPPETLAIWLGGWGRGMLAWGLVWLIFSTAIVFFLMISPNLLDIWAMFFLILSRCETLHFFIRT